MLTLTTYCNLPDADRLHLARDVQGLGTLAELIRWGLGQSPEHNVVEVVVQDEYTHDVVIEWRSGRHLVFDTT